MNIHINIIHTFTHAQSMEEYNIRQSMEGMINHFKYKKIIINDTCKQFYNNVRKFAENLWRFVWKSFARLYREHFG
jgi:hypothetical protein